MSVMLWILGLAAAGGGVIAAISGFGIGSVLTPTLGLAVPAKLAVAAVSVPHFVATAYRLWLVREHVDRKILFSFGVTSATGGLLGAVVNLIAASRSLEIVLAALLLFVGIGGLTGWTKRLRFEGPWAWAAGAVSGFLGGLVGNQGGLRAGAMIGLGVNRDAFVATSTATGLIVDCARMPVYVATQGPALWKLLPEMTVMTVGVLVGTVLGVKVVRRLPEALFSQVVSTLLILLAAWLLAKPGGSFTYGTPVVAHLRDPGRTDVVRSLSERRANDERTTKGGPRASDRRPDRSTTGRPIQEPSDPSSSVAPSP